MLVNSAKKEDAVSVRQFVFLQDKVHNISMGQLLISRADYRTTSARRRTTAHPTIFRRFLCSGFVLSRKVSCVLMNMILVKII
jgi:hypothetical protein